LAVDQIALDMQFFCGHHFGTCTQHQTCGSLGVGCGLSTCLANILIEQIFKYRAVALEARGRYVGQVIGNDVHARLLRVQAGLGNP